MLSLYSYKIITFTHPHTLERLHHIHLNGTQAACRGKRECKRPIMTYICERIPSHVEHPLCANIS